MAETEPVVTTHVEETVIENPNAAEPEEMEVTQEWVENLFAESNAKLEAISQAMAAMATPLTLIVERLSSMENRVPENLANLLSDQQAQITNLIAEMMTTVRSLLTPPEPPPVIVEKEPESVEGDPVVVETPSEPVRHRPRRI